MSLSSSDQVQWFLIVRTEQRSRQGMVGFILVRRHQGLSPKIFKHIQDGVKSLGIVSKRHERCDA